MLEPMLVDHPTVHPYACVACGLVNPPMLDTHREVAVNGNAYRVYICSLCAKTHSRVFGYSDGKRMDDLEKSAKLLLELHRQVETLDGELRDSKRKHLERDRLEREMKGENEHLAARVSQMENHLREQARAAQRDLALVGDGPAAA